jgi:succinate dehydrogenase / fumarate reductase, membrane anchor subunit
MSLQTPLHKAQGLGSSHSGVAHFWRQRVAAVALIPLSVWFAISVLGLVGTGIVPVLIFLSNPLNAVLMGAFVVIALYHLALGLQEVILDYVPHPGFRFFLMILTYFFAFAVGSASVFALLRIVGTT